MGSTYGYEPDELLRYHIKQAEHHARAAYDLLYKTPGPKRGVFFKMAVGRAQSILMSLHVRETTEQSREERDREQRST
jgi:hypothetical protein